jgi:hypothetical protein
MSKFKKMSLHRNRVSAAKLMKDKPYFLLRRSSFISAEISHEFQRLQQYAFVLIFVGDAAPELSQADPVFIGFSPPAPELEDKEAEAKSPPREKPNPKK